MAPTSAAATNIANHLNQPKQKVVLIMGPTGSGKSKLSIDLSTLYFNSSTEIINSDKMQLYNGLEITTNKISEIDRKGVTHHLLGDFYYTKSTPEFTPSAFRSKGEEIISEITLKRRVPFIVGGSNSFIYSLLAKTFDPNLDFFDESTHVDFSCMELRYDCCFIFVNVDLHVLNEYLDMRVDEMLDSGMLEELAEFFESELSKLDNHFGIKKAIGVPEFETYLKQFYSCGGPDVEEYERAVRLIKENTRMLAKRQMWKIQRLREAGWDLQDRSDATSD
ncbi:hypothetical protein Leryth_021311 [Lithospermum erythrorhizon]|nr:hypothetical protein Leryth_021311 [Lithospermum erythrorhizon]